MPDTSESFVNMEDRGGSLFVRVVRPNDGGTVPVVIDRAAFEDHFGAGHGTKDLAAAYLAHEAVINARVLELDPSGDLYTNENPMLLGTGDFSQA